MSMPLERPISAPDDHHQPSALPHQAAPPAPTRCRCAALLRTGLLGLLGLTMALGLTYRLWLPLLGEWLVASETPTAADAIIVLGGERGERTRTGVRFYTAGLAPALVTTGDGSGMHEIIGKSQAELDAELAERLGVPRSAIFTLDRSTSTREDALLTRELAEAHGWAHLLVVTSPYHTQRSGMVFRRVFADSPIILTITAAQPSENIPSLWWTQERDLLSVTGEYLKFAYYALKGWL